MHRYPSFITVIWVGVYKGTRKTKKKLYFTKHSSIASGVHIVCFLRVLCWEISFPIVPKLEAVNTARKERVYSAGYKVKGGFSDVWYKLYFLWKLMKRRLSFSKIQSKITQEHISLLIFLVQLFRFTIVKVNN